MSSANSATVHRATTKADRKTEIGNRNFLMSYISCGP